MRRLATERSRLVAELGQPPFRVASLCHSGGRPGETKITSTGRGPAGHGVVDDQPTRERLDVARKCAAGGGKDGHAVIPTLTSLHHLASTVIQARVVSRSSTGRRMSRL